jgi:diguanylate cyclase (GGDEF)-like protein
MGYPDGMKGRDIPLEARIVAVADVFDALTSKRVYKEAYSAERAYEIIEASSGSHFDPAIVDAFLLCYERFKTVIATRETASNALAPQVNRHLSPTGGLSPRPAHARIVVADSDAETRQIIAGWLTDAGHDVYQVADIEQAVATIQQESPQFVIVGSRPPTLEANDLCHWVRTARLPNYVYTFSYDHSEFNSEQSIAKHPDTNSSSADEVMPLGFGKDELLARLNSAGRIVQLEDQLQRLAVADSLTGLPTRQYVEPQMLREWHRSVRHCVPLTCAVLDIDKFEETNAEHGYKAGDILLKEVAAIVQGHSRASDCLCRISGDSFLLLLPECNEQGAARCLERIRESIAGHSVAVKSATGGNIEMRATVSTGVAQRYHDTANLDELVTMAEQALRMAKESGRNRVAKYGLVRSLDTGASQIAKIREGTSLLAKDVMTTPISCLRESTSVREASRYLSRFGLTSIPVVDDEGRLAGILSERDLLSDMSTPETAKRAIHHSMTIDVVCFQEDELAQSIGVFLADAVIRRVVIVKGDRPTGIISRGTLLRHFNCEYDMTETEASSSDFGDAESDDALAARISTEVGVLARDLQEGIPANEAHESLLPV